MMREKSFKSNFVRVFIALFFIVSVLYPLFRMLLSIGEADVVKFISSDNFIRGLKNSLYTSVTATLLSILLAFILAWSIMRTSIRFKGVFSVLLTLPMLIPSISHGMGLIILFGTNGVVTNFLGLNWNIYGFWGIVMGSVIYSFPISFLMISDILRYEDSSPYEAAGILGFSKWDKLKAITLPYMRKPMIAVIFANFTMIVTDYGVPLMIGGKFTTLPVLMYQEVIGRLNFDKGAIIGIVLLVPALIAFLIDLLNKDRASSSFLIKDFDIRRGRGRDSLGYAAVISTIIFVTLPILAFIVLTFTKNYPVNMSFTLDNITKTFNMKGSDYLINSLLISLMVSVIGTITAFATGYLTVRMPTKLSAGLHLVSITSLAIPGLVLGLSYVIAFNGSFIYGTLGILILVNLVHFFASPYLMIYNTMGKINENLEAVGSTLGIGRLRMIKDVFIPQTFGTILEMFSYFFVNSMITISAVSFLANTRNRPISLMINQFEGNRMIEASAFVSLLILGVNILLKASIFMIKRMRMKRGLR